MLNDPRGRILVAHYRKDKRRPWRWWPNPPSRRTGSQRWAVPSVSEWHPAATLEACGKR